jgi:hypothetical protein
MAFVQHPVGLADPGCHPEEELVVTAALTHGQIGGDDAASVANVIDGPTRASAGEVSSVLHI